MMMGAPAASCAMGTGSLSRD